LHHKDLLAFARNRPHVLIAGLAIGAIAVRQYKDAVIDPIKAWVTGK
jgi:hypothetical protein